MVLTLCPHYGKSLAIEHVKKLTFNGEAFAIMGDMLFLAMRICYFSLSIT